MKKLFTLVTLFISCLIYSQNYHYSSYSNYLDYIGYDNILKNKISKIEIHIEDLQVIKIHFNEKAQIEKIETLDSSLNKIISESIFKWNSNFNYLLSSLSNYNPDDFTFMTKSDYTYLRDGDKKMSPVDVTQYWIKNTLFWYAEKYNFHNYINTITRSLDGAIDYLYFENKLLKSIKIRKVSSDEFSNERSVIYPKHHIQENKTVEFEYDSFKNIKNIRNYFREGLTKIQAFNYNNNLLSNIEEKTDYNNSSTKISYSNNLVIKTSQTSDLYPDPFISTIVYYIGDKKINLMNSDNNEKNKEILNEIPPNFLQKYNTDSSLNSIKQLFGEPDKLMTPSGSKNVYSYYYELKNGFLMIDSKDNIGIEIISIESNGEKPFIEIGNSCPVDFYNGEKIKLGFSKFKDLMDGSDVDIEISRDRCNKLGFYTRFGGNPCYYKNFLYGNIIDSDNFDVDYSKLGISNVFFEASYGKIDLKSFSDQVIEYIIVSDDEMLLKDIHPYGEGIHCSYKY